MNRFLKKEWDDAEIPASAYMRARNNAWSAIQGNRPRRRNALVPAAILAGGILTLVFLVVQLDNAGRHANGTAARKEGTRKPVASTSTVTAVAAVPSSAPANRKEPIAPAAAVLAGRRRDRLDRETKPGLNRANFPAQPAQPANAAPERLVMNFTLPESGVRVIWTLEKDFRIDGEMR
ncbi:MAG TPA: hypothetical protein VGK99_18700 [Acidobacteriota bacterium]|jgi:hypothetical protein